MIPINPDAATTVNVDQVQALLGGDDLQRFVARLQRRMAQGKPLTGKLQLSQASGNERSAIARLLGRAPTNGNSLTIDLDRLTQLLAHARACDSLEKAVTALVGPVTNQRSRAEATQRAWEQLWQAARRRLQSNLQALAWIEDLRTSGLLKRIAGGDHQAAQGLLDQAVSLVKEVPFPAIRLAELAAATTGNSHSLDKGFPLSALVIRYSRQLTEAAEWKTAAGRRDAWESLGVLCDEVSGPVLVLNLRADNESLTGRALNLHADAGEPYRISVRQLRRQPPTFHPHTTGPIIFVCENPTVVDVAANKLGRACRPLVCLDGQPKTGGRMLLDHLTKAGCELRYHGDFDWDGVRIANTITQVHGATSWQFGASDYSAASKGEWSLAGLPATPSWDPQLGELMAQVGKCVHEEILLESLLGDLASPG
jgi:uncharacterized protein (TIGR02679 family)